MTSASIMFLFFSFLFLADIDDEQCLTDHNDVTTGLYKGLVLQKNTVGNFSLQYYVCLTCP